MQIKYVKREKVKEMVLKGDGFRRGFWRDRGNFLARQML